MIRKLRIEEVLAPPGRIAITSGCVTAPDAISNEMETMQYIMVLLQSDLCCLYGSKCGCGSGESFSNYHTPINGFQVSSICLLFYVGFVPPHLQNDFQLYFCA